MFVPGYKNISTAICCVMKVLVPSCKGKSTGIKEYVLVPGSERIFYEVGRIQLRKIKMAVFIGCYFSYAFYYGTGFVLYSFLFLTFTFLFKCI